MKKTSRERRKGELRSPIIATAVREGEIEGRGISE